MTVTTEEIKSLVFQLLKETFEGPPPQQPSAFLDKGAGLFQTLDGINADVASARIGPGGATIAAHTHHLRFYVDVHFELIRGSTKKINWTESWVLQEVAPAEWEDLKRKLLGAYSRLDEHLRTQDVWSEDEVGVGMAIVAHTAYHLGAIRQLGKALKPRWEDERTAR